MNLTRSLSFLALGLAACSTPAPVNPAVDAGGRDAAMAPAPDLLGCKYEDGAADLGGTCIQSVSGKVVDDKGQPIPGLVVTVCAGDCFFGKTGTDGSFTVSIGYYVQPSLYALDLHAQPTWAAYYLPLPPVSGEAVKFTSPVPLLPIPQDGPTIARDGSAQTLTAAGLTLTIPAGTTVFLSPEDAEKIDVGARFRPLLVTTPQLVPFLPAGPAPLALYAFGPFEVVFSQPVSVSFPNTTGLSAGTQVEFWEQRGLLSRPPPAGGLALVGTGQVSADGQRIETAQVKTLTWIAIRKKGS